MDSRAAKLALARKKLKNHQEKKVITAQKQESNFEAESPVQDNTTPTVDIIKEPDNVDASNFNSDKCNLHNMPNQILIEPAPMLPDNHILQPELNVTEILISTKRNLELQINELQNKLNLMENEHSLIISELNATAHRAHRLENELKKMEENYIIAKKELQQNNDVINELNTIKSSFLDQNNNLLEQLEFTKTMLTAKETENASLHSQLSNLQNQLDGTQLQLKQLINGSSFEISNSSETSLQNEALLQKISALEHQLVLSQKERDQVSMHYEQYVGELNEHLKAATTKNEELRIEILNLSNREASLVEQISELEIRLQNYNFKRESIECQVKDNTEMLELEKKYNLTQNALQELKIKYEEMQIKYLGNEAKLKELIEAQQPEYNKQEDISLSKLNADIASDKIAAQRATEQNKKLKIDMQELEEAFVKMSRDKLELTEKLTAEKFLNRELTLKLAEIEEKAKDLQIKVMAKDEEMIRIQTSCRDMEKQYEKLREELKKIENNSAPHLNTETLLDQSGTHTENHFSEDTGIVNILNACQHEEEHRLLENNNDSNRVSIEKEDAMTKLQERFLKIMEEVADLSDEKHRLEHIILQLQNETDTICEYVALYQQQRSLLKKRDEERCAQIKMFEDACDKLKSEVEELSNILTKFGEDQELTQYFQVDSKRNDLEKVKIIISHLKNNCLIDPLRKNVDFKSFYPCSCCSGRLLEV